MKLTIAHLYPNLMNIYSDMGNIICLKKRCQWRGIETKVVSIGIGQKFDWQKYDLVFGGGGQDRQQEIVSKDLLKKKKALKDATEANIPMLTTCGTYQLFGHYFKTHEGKIIKGISVFDAYTIASHQRKIGNIIIEIDPKSNIFRVSPDNYRDESRNISILSSRLRSNNKFVGFENHSGNTFLNNDSTSEVKSSDTSEVKERNQTTPLGKVIKGFGNNGKDKTEGAIYKNCIGTYLHGPILPKNSHLADWLIKIALEKKYQRKIELKPLNDTLEWQTHKQAIRRA